MVDHPDTDLDRDVDESMRLFQRSQTGPAAAITPIEPSRVLLVLDGSSQDETSGASAQYLRERFNTETLLLDGRDEGQQQPPDLATDRVAVVSGSRPIARKRGEAYEAILAALDEHDVDLVIVPCPFGRSFARVGTDSAGTVIDVLLSRCNRPLLVIRRDDQRIRDCVGNVYVVVGAECDVENRAAAWAFGLADRTATVTLNLVVEKEHFENIRSIIEALDPEQTLDSERFSDALTKTHQSLHGAMAKTAAETEMTYRLRPQAGAAAPPNPLDDQQRMLLVLPLEVDDRFGQGFVQDRIRRSPHPLLIVPGHVRG